MTLLKGWFLPNKYVGFPPAPTITRKTHSRWRTSRLDLLLAGAAILLLRLLRDAEAWATSVHIFSPPCLNVLALVRRVGVPPPFWPACSKYSPLVFFFRRECYCHAQREYLADKGNKQSRDARCNSLGVKTKHSRDSFIGDNK